MSHPDVTDPAALSIDEADRLIEAGALSPLELTRAALARIQETDGALNAFVLVMAESALEEARAAEQRAHDGARLGPLDGIPIAVKDLYDTAGAVTTGGTGAYRERVPHEDAAAVARLREAGAVILGKTNTHELAFGGTTNNLHYGPTRNPWDTTRVPGGSSGGSGAALAARQALGALGSDTGGSIRIPAAFCGVTGHKPTYGRVSRFGVIPMSHTLDHAGPMARSALDCALMLNVLQGYDARDLDSVPRPAEDFAAGIERAGEPRADGDRPLEGVALAVIPSLLANTAPGVLAAFEASLEMLRGLGATVREVEAMPDYLEWRNRALGIMSVESYEYAEHLMTESPETIGEPVRRRIAVGATTPAHHYSRALDARKLIERRFEETLASEALDGYVLPTSPITAFPIDADAGRDDAPNTIFQNTTVFDLTHQPAISVPNGFDEDSLPTGLMVAGALWQDAQVLRIGDAYQRATDFHLRRPEIAHASNVEA